MTQPAGTPAPPAAPAIQNPTAPVVVNPQDDDAVLARLGQETDTARKAKEAAGESGDSAVSPADDEFLGESPRDGSEQAAEGSPTEEEAAAAAAEAALSPLDRAKAAAAKARESAGRNRHLMAQQKNLARQNAAAQQQIAQLQHQNEQARRFQQQLAQDPYAAMKALGMTEEQLAHRAVREGTPERMIEKVQQQLHEERAARIALENRLVAERQNVAVKQGEVKFLQESLKDEYPNLAEMPERLVLTMAKSEVEELTAQGYDLSDFPDADLCALIEHRLATGKRKKAAPAVAPGAKPPVPPKPGAKPVTLTNGLGAKKYTMPANFEQLSQDDQFAHLGKMAELTLKK